MGMYDTVRCEAPLPDGFTGGLQTKDLYCQLDLITITAEGRLLRQESDLEPVPPHERPHPDPADPLHFIGSQRAINIRQRDLDFHGDLNFYGSGREIADWHEYTARFTEGQLIRITAKDTDDGDRR